MIAFATDLNRLTGRRANQLAQPRRGGNGIESDARQGMSGAVDRRHCRVDTEDHIKRITTIINCTNDHAIPAVNRDQVPTVLVFRPSDTVARVVVRRTPAETVTCDRFGLFNVEFVVEGLPDPAEGVYYIVSREVALCLRGTRQDLLVRGEPIMIGDDHVADRGFGYVSDPTPHAVDQS